MPDPDLSPLDFDAAGDLEPIEVPVKFRGRHYVLREASEDAAVKYRTAVLRGARMEDGKIVAMTGLPESEPVLVAGCLFELVDQPTNGTPPDRHKGLRPVTREFVGGMPSRVVKQLFIKAQEISDLEKDEEPRPSGQEDPGPKG